MSNVISKTLTVTRVKYQTVAIEDGTPKFVEHPDAVFRGILTPERAQRMLQNRLGKDVILVIIDVDAGQKRYEMDLEQFVLHAQEAGAADEDEADEADEADEDEADENEVGEPAEAVDEDGTELEEGESGEEPPESEGEPAENPPSEEPASGESEELSDEDKRRFAPPSWW